jgi:riboflavin kinase/FMN adenylyltransferase
MIVVKDINDIKYDKNSAITVGTFDGVHLGHRKIIFELNRVKKEKSLRSMVITFDPHPQIVLKNKTADIKLLTSAEEKLEIFRSLNIDFVFVINFTKKFSETGAEDFYKRYLIEKIGLSHLVLGYDHMFGKNREGNFDTLKNLSQQYDFEVDKVREFKVEDKHVSSSVIRKLLLSGDIAKANKFLGREYSLKGIVVKGKKLGRELNYPTANIEVSDKSKLIPKNGIYAVKILIDGREYSGMMSIGYNPTVSDDNTLKLEVNIFNFNDDIYGKEIEVGFIEYLREEIKYKSIEELVSQLENDKKKSLILIKEYKTNSKK